MDSVKIPMSEVLTEDEKLVADFIRTRTKKVLADIQALSEAKVQDPDAWSESFAYLSRTYGRNSDETFKWYKYYFRERLIPDAIALPLLVQVYLDGAVDKGFVNTLVRAMKREPEDVKAARLDDMRCELAEYIDEEGLLTVYRGSFEKPFGKEDDASRPIDRAFCFTLDPEVARHYACCWYPETAKVYKVKTPLTDVAWHNLYDEEKNVILMPQSKGGVWQVAEETVIPASEYGAVTDEKSARQAYTSLFK